MAIQIFLSQVEVNERLRIRVRGLKDDEPCGKKYRKADPR